MPTKFVTNPRRAPALSPATRIKVAASTYYGRDEAEHDETYETTWGAFTTMVEDLSPRRIFLHCAESRNALPVSSKYNGDEDARALADMAAALTSSPLDVTLVLTETDDHGGSARFNVSLATKAKSRTRRKNPASSRPSVKTLSQIVTRAQANSLRDLMENASVEHVLRSASRMMDGFDVEYIRSNNDTMRTPDGLDYVNMGDTYDLTLIYDHGKGKYVVSSWGDIVEADMRLPASRRRFD